MNEEDKIAWIEEVSFHIIDNGKRIRKTESLFFLDCQTPDTELCEREWF